MSTNIRQASFLVASMTLAAAACLSCSKETKMGGGTKSNVTQTKSEPSPRRSAGEANAVPGLPPGKVELDGNTARRKDNDAFLEQLVRNSTKEANAYTDQKVAEEAAARLAADDELKGRVDVLEKRVDGLETKLTSEVARLDAQDQVLAGRVGELDESTKARFGSLQTEMGAKFADQQAAVDKVRADLSAKITTEVQSLRTATQGDLSKMNERLALTDPALKAQLQDLVQGSLPKVRDEVAHIFVHVKKEFSYHVRFEGDLNNAADDAALRALLTKRRDSLSSDAALADDALVRKTLQDEVAALDKLLAMPMPQARNEILASVAGKKDGLAALIAKLEARLAKSDADFKSAMLALVEGESKAYRLEIQASITSIAFNFGRALSEMRDATSGELQRKIAEIEGKLASADAAVRKDLETQKDSLLSQLEEATMGLRSELSDRMDRADNALRLELQADFTSKFNSQAKDLQSYRAYAEANFATKAQFNALGNVVKGLVNATALLNSRIDDQSAAHARLSDEVKALRTELKSDIAGVQADVDGVKVTFIAHVNTFKLTVVQLTDKAMKEAQALRDLIASNQVRNDASIAALGDKVQALTTRVADAEGFATQTREALGGKVLELQQRDAELSDEVRKAREAATKELVNAIKVEQDARAGMQAELAKLTEEVARVRDVANQALQLAEANKLAVSGLKNELENVRTEFKAELGTLRNDMQAAIGEVRSQAEQMVGKLGSEVGKQFGEITAALAELRARDAAVGNDLVRDVVGILRKPELFSSVNERSLPSQNALVANAGNLGGTIALVEQEFLAAIDVVHGKKGVDILAMNASFKIVAGQATCGGISGEKQEDVGRNSSVADREWYWHLARAYVSLIATGTRPGDADLAKIYFGTAPLASGGSLQSAIVVASLPSYAAGTGADCETLTADWTKRLLASSDALAVTLRKVIAENPRLKDAVTKALVPRAIAIAAPAKAYEDLVVGVLKENGLPESDVVKYLDGGLGGKPSFRAQAAQVVSQRVELQREIASRRTMADSITDLAKEVAVQEDKADSNAKAVAKLQSDVQVLNVRITQVAEVAAAKNRQVESGLKAAFNLIAGIAARLGYEDFVYVARQEVAKLGGTIDPKFLFPVQCSGTSHFFNYASQGQALQRCDTGIDTGNGVIKDNGQCRTLTRVHSAKSTNVNTAVTQLDAVYWRPVHVINGRCFANPAYCGSQYWTAENLGTVRQTTSSISVTNATKVSTWQQPVFIGDLRAPILPPANDEARALLKRKAGDPFPADRKTMFGLRVFGNAWYWRITNMKNQSVVVAADDFKVKDAPSGIVYEIPASLFLAREDGGAGFTESARVEALDARGQPMGKQCMHSMNGGVESTTSQVVTYSSSYSYQGAVTFQMPRRQHVYYSPIVLDLDGKGSVETIDAQSSNALFDLDGDGRVEKVGWVRRGGGILAIDLNGNGKVDDGRELFGDYTRLAGEGRNAYDGYEALAQYDRAGKGHIDATDPAFAKLKVWIDADGDGVSRKGELRSLASLGITRVGVRKSDVPLAMQSQHADKPVRNVVLYEGRFWGPAKCGTEGCKSFDVYFGEDAALRLAGRE